MFGANSTSTLSFCNSPTIRARELFFVPRVYILVYVTLKFVYVTLNFVYVTLKLLLKFVYVTLKHKLVFFPKAALLPWKRAQWEKC